MASSATAPTTMGDLLPRVAGLPRLPIGLVIFGGIFAYGVSKPNDEAKWLGGIGLASLAVEYFAARRMLQLSAAAAAAAPAGAIAVSPGVDYIPPAGGDS